MLQLVLIDKKNKALLQFNLEPQIENSFYHSGNCSFLNSYIQTRILFLALLLIGCFQPMSSYCIESARFEPIPNMVVSGLCEWEMRRNTNSNRIPPTIMEMNCLNPNTVCSGNILFNVSSFIYTNNLCYYDIDIRRFKSRLMPVQSELGLSIPDSFKNLEKVQVWSDRIYYRFITTILNSVWHYTAEWTWKKCKVCTWSILATSKPVL